MIMVNIHKVKTYFSTYFAKLQKEETVILCKRNVPVAEIRAISKPAKKTRPIGLAKNIIKIPPSFFEDLPEEILSFF
jgi:antitoxin (DNA-binding transcriptional repressor) of toxin-antitoxin stability system